jgi:hypothetical protein
VILILDNYGQLFATPSDRKCVTTNSTTLPDAGVTALSMLAGVLKLHNGAKCVDLLNVDEHSKQVKQSLENAQCAPDHRPPRLIRR